VGSLLRVHFAGSVLSPIGKRIEASIVEVGELTPPEGVSPRLDFGRPSKKSSASRC
jgi:hypothetical protein